MFWILLYVHPELIALNYHGEEMFKILEILIVFHFSQLITPVSFKNSLLMDLKSAYQTVTKVLQFNNGMLYARVPVLTIPAPLVIKLLKQLKEDSQNNVN